MMHSKESHADATYYSQTAHPPWSDINDETFQEFLLNVLTTP